MRIDQSQFVSDNTNRTPKQERLYCVLGSEDFTDDKGYPRCESDESKVCAKATPDKPTKHFGDERGNDYRYYIRMDADQELFNPVNLLSSVKDKKNNHFINSVCKSTSSFKEVAPSVFNKYIEYLKSKDIRWLKEAQRELV